MSLSPPFVLTIAGYDPSAGAGVLADVKAFEHCKVYGQAICTALTIQNENSFSKSGWVTWKNIKAQLNILSSVRDFCYIKIGLVESPDILEKILKCLRKRYPKAFILWDPIIKASSGFEFHKQNAVSWQKLFCYVNLITPNLPEAEFLGISKGSPKTAVLVKGGHSKIDEDRLFLPNSPTPIRFKFKRIKGIERHGSGCTLSALIVANMAKYNDLGKSITESKKSMQIFFQQGSKKLGSLYPLATTPNPIPHTPLYPLHILTWDGSPLSHLEQVRQLLEAGAKWIQLRQKKGTKAEKLKTAKAAVKLAKKYNATLIINDSPQIALKSGAHGVHLGLNDCPVSEARKLLGKKAIIGGTANTPEQAKQREAEGCNYIGLGPLRKTGTKENLSKVLGKSGVKKVLNQNLKIPVIVIGGVTPADVPEILSMGASGVAVSSYVVASGDIKKALGKFITTRP